MLSQSEVGRRPVAVQDAVLRVRCEGLSVETNSQRKLPLLAGLVTAAHTFQELGFAQGGWTAGTGNPILPFPNFGQGDTGR